MLFLDRSERGAAKERCQKTVWRTQPETFIAFEYDIFDIPVKNKKQVEELKATLKSIASIMT